MRHVRHDARYGIDASVCSGSARPRAPLGGDDGIDIERASATWSTSSFTSYHGQLLSLAVQWGVAIEIERAIKKSARFC